MKKLFAMIALIFTIGMTVDFSPGDSPPEQTEFSISEFTAPIQADVTNIGSQLTEGGELTTKLNTKQ